MTSFKARSSNVPYGLDPDENGEMRERIEAEPKRFLLIPGLDHGEHHDILKAFLRSDWARMKNSTNLLEMPISDRSAAGKKPSVMKR